VPKINPVTNSSEPLTVKMRFHPNEPGGTKEVALVLFAVVFVLFEVKLETVVLVEFYVSLIEFG
jgi:hypothetical protein